MKTIEGAYYQGSSNVVKFKRVYFSPRKNKFIKAIRRWGDSVSGFYEYLLYYGDYVVFDYSFWSKGDPRINFAIEIANLEGEIIKSVKFEVDNSEDITEFMKGRKGLEIVQDFLKSLPRYHVKPGLKELSNKIYSEDVVKDLIEFIQEHNWETIFTI